MTQSGIEYGLAIVLLCAILAACGRNSDSRPSAVLNGTATLDGKPLEEGSLYIASRKTGESAYCNLGPGGTFQVTFPSADINETYEAWITRTDPNPEGTPADEGKPPLKFAVNIPKKYFSRTDSGLTTTLKPGENQVNFALESK